MHFPLYDHSSDSFQAGKSRIRKSGRGDRKGGRMIALAFAVFTAVLIIGRHELADVLAWAISRFTR